MHFCVFGVLFTFFKSFGVAIDAWAKADDKISSANHAEGLLMRMEELFLPVATNNRRDMLSNVPYNIVIDAWSRRSGCAERAEKILRRLIDKHEETNNPYLKPGELTEITQSSRGQIMNLRSSQMSELTRL